MNLQQSHKPSFTNICILSYLYTYCNLASLLGTPVQSKQTQNLNISNLMKYKW